MDTDWYFCSSARVFVCKNRQKTSQLCILLCILYKERIKPTRNMEIFLLLRESPKGRRSYISYLPPPPPNAPPLNNSLSVRKVFEEKYILKDNKFYLWGLLKFYISLYPIFIKCIKFYCSLFMVSYFHESTRGPTYSQSSHNILTSNIENNTKYKFQEALLNRHLSNQLVNPATSSPADDVHHYVIPPKLLLTNRVYFQQTSGINAPVGKRKGGSLSSSSPIADSCNVATIARKHSLLNLREINRNNTHTALASVFPKFFSIFVVTQRNDI
jgi:hypothetical protein